MDGHEREVRALLRESGARLKRTTGSGQEMWLLPGNQTFFCNKTGHAKDWRSWKNALSDLRRMLGTGALVEEASAGGRAVAAGAVHHAEPPAPPPFNAPRLALAPPPTEEPMQAKKEEPTRTRVLWTPEQDKVLIEAFELGMKAADVAALLRDVRPGVTSGAAAGRYSYIKQEVTKAVEPHKEEPMNKSINPVVTELPPRPAPPPAPLSIQAPPGTVNLVWVSFEMGDGSKPRVIAVDKETARAMIAKAMEL